MGRRRSGGREAVYGSVHPEVLAVCVFHYEPCNFNLPSKTAPKCCADRLQGCKSLMWLLSG